MITLLPTIPPLPNEETYTQAVAYIAAGSPSDLTPYPYISVRLVSGVTALQEANNILNICGNIWN